MGSEIAGRDTDHALAALMRVCCEDVSRDGTGFPALLFGFSLTRIRPEQSTTVDRKGNDNASPQKD